MFPKGFATEEPLGTLTTLFGEDAILLTAFLNNPEPPEPPELLVWGLLFSTFFTTAFETFLISICYK